MDNKRTLKTNRSLVKFFFLSIITLGIYGIITMEHVTSDLNVLASKHDGKKTMEYMVMFCFLSVFTLGIGALVWYSRFSGRIGEQIKLRNIKYKFGKGTFWGWCVFGTLLCGVGPFVYFHKMFKAVNKLCKSYNKYGE